MGRALSGTTAVAVAVAAWANHVPSADAFSPAMIASTASAFGCPSSATISRRQARSRRPSPSMKVAGAQPQQQDAWLAGGVKTRELFNALSQGEIGKRAFTQALAKRMMAKATGMQRDYELSEAAGQAAASSAVVNSSGDLSNMESSWNKRGYGSAISRSVEVWVFGAKILFKEIKLRKVEDAAEKSQKRAAIAVQLKDGLLRLGPTFIKLGQLLSTRIDVVPKEYIKELVMLQDNVPGFPFESAKRIIEEDLGQPLEELYETVSEVPLAAASLGQVHLAKIKGGEQVAVKVQRAGLKDLFDQDLKNLKLLVKVLDKLDPKFDGADRDWVSIYEESAKLLYKEIDYINEAENAVRFKENFQDTPWVKVPDVYWNMTSERVVTMEFVPGVKINNLEEIDRRGIDRKLLAKRSAEAYLTQLCRHGFFHCDPHPGNVACDEQDGGRLIFYDFGMMDEFKPNVRSGLVNLIFSTYENDPRAVCDALVEMGILKAGSDRISVEKIARSFLGEFTNTLNQGQDGKWTSELTKEDKTRLRKERRAKLGEDLLSVSGDVPFKFPPTFTFVFRAFTSLDGIGKGLDTKYDLTRLAQPYLKELLDVRDGSFALSFAKTFVKKVGWRPEDLEAVVKSPRNVAYVENITRKLEQGDLKLRVRVLESERAFERLELTQTSMYDAIAFSTFLNAALILSATGSAGSPLLPVRVAWTLAGVFGLRIPVGLFKIRKQDQKYSTYGLK
ncbi:unnamed protein product [Ectocarpus sp. CCAP 1310/34]|nr:unnamed protein product [Ectocarpus sp. CCAP 1310/34]